MVVKKDKWKEGKENINMWCSPAFAAAVDAWRKQQPVVPSLSKAVELLARMQLGMPLRDPEGEGD